MLAFPCNQFGGQEPGTNTEVKARALCALFCSLVLSSLGFQEAFAQAKCPDTFPLFAKIDVNGANEAPLSFQIGPSAQSKVCTAKPAHHGPR